MSQVDSLIAAIQNREIDTIRIMLAEHPGLADGRTDSGVSLVLTALYLGNPEAAEVIADQKSSLDLPEAVAMGRAKQVEEMLSSGGHAVRAYTPDGFTPLHLAAFFGRSELFNLLTETGADVNAIADNPSKVRPIHSAAASRNAAAVRELLALGADPDAQQHGGYTALQSAAAHGNLEMIKVLLAAGADKTILTDEGQSAVDLARKQKHDAAAELIESHAND
jgi:ankyrin repeat protein